MKRAVMLLLCISLLFSCGCASVLDGETLEITEHVPVEKQNEVDTVAAEVSNYAALRNAVYALVAAHQTEGTIRLINYELENHSSNIESDINRACAEVSNEEPLGLYSVYYIGNSVTSLVAFTEADITVTYKRDQAQVSSLTTVYTERFLRSEILDMMRSYNDYGAFYVSLDTLTSAEVEECVRSTYYDNPLDIVMMNLESVSMYPESGRPRILELVFSSKYSASQRTSMTRALNSAVNKLVESAGGRNDASLLLSLCQLLIDTSSYDILTDESFDYAPDDLIATAYGALVSGRAVSDGYALALKALCDKLGLDCVVVNGMRNGISHMWNIVRIGDYCYHVDASMCDENGINTAFLQDDYGFSEEYEWDTDKYPTCNGPLNYAVVSGTNDMEE